MNVLPQRIGSTQPHSRTTVFERDQFRNPHLKLDVNLSIVRSNAEAIANAVGVALLPVVKADAYGLGVEAICDTIADLAAGFCVFQAREAVMVQLARRTGKRVLALGPPEFSDPDDYIAHRVTPTVCNPVQARQLRKARPALCIDTGMQRFSCPPDDCRASLIAGDCREAFTHATQLCHVERLRELTSGYDLERHAAGSGLLHDQRARLDAVRPGLALYRNAISISSRIVELHNSRGPAGYSGFVAARHGVILAGYSHGLRKGPCIINGRKSRILEVGMQSAFVESSSKDRIGDDVILLGEELTEFDLAPYWNCGPHEVLTSMSSAATRHFLY
jgi:alanine racemase